jgi:hypothetical protein
MAAELTEIVLRKSRLLAPQQWLFRVLCGQGHDRICELRLTPTATHEANVAKVVATISLKRIDFYCIVRGHHFVPVQPQSPAIGQGIGQFNLHNTRPLPVPPPPGRRMKAPEIIGSPLEKMLGNGPFDFLH